MATVNDILSKKGKEVVSMAAGETVQRAAELMNQRKIGGLVVTDGGKMVGIFTERDVLRRVVAEPHDPAVTVLRDVMTTPVASCRSETSLEECVGVMARKRIRHLPVVDDESVCGLITSSDLLEFQMTEHEATIRYLSSYSFETGGEAG